MLEVLLGYFTARQYLFSVQVEKLLFFLNFFQGHIFLIKSGFEFLDEKIFLFFEKIRRDSCIIGEKPLVLHRKFNQ